MEVDKLSHLVAATANYSSHQQTNFQVRTTENEQIPPLDTDIPAVQYDQISLASSPITRKNLEIIKTIEQEHTKLYLLVQNVRLTNEQLDQTADQVGRLHATVTTIIKNNPPFPPDSEQRKELLMSYASIRKEIIKMTVPAPPQPVYEKIKETWASLFGQDGRIFHDAVPELQATSSDWDVHTAARNLVTTGEKLANLSSGVTRSLISP